MTQSSLVLSRFRVAILLVISAFIGRSFCIGTVFPTVGSSHHDQQQRDHYDDENSHTSSSTTQRELKKPAGTNVIGTNVVGADSVGKVHIIYGLMGNRTGFINEFHVSLKSVIMNAPIDMGLDIHVLTDVDAFNNLERVTEEEIMLHTLVSRHQISIVVYNIERRRREWQKRIASYTGRRLSKKHTKGTFFRLFAFDALPEEVEHVVYLDTDAVIVSNLQELWRQRNSTCFFQWGLEARCAGFMILNLRKMRQEFWNMVNATFVKNYAREVDDQEIFRHMQLNFPQYVGSIPVEWDNHLANNFGKLNGKNLLKRRPRMGMLHFNGAGSRDSFAYDDPKRIEFSVVPYIANHPWQWVGFMLKSEVPPGMPGYPVILKMTVL